MNYLNNEQPTNFLNIMSILDQSNQITLKKKRSLSEKLLGFFIFLTIAFTFQAFTLFFLSDYSFKLWSVKKIFSISFLLFYSLSFISFFSIWKNFLIKDLKLEATIFLLFQSIVILWAYLFFSYQNSYLSFLVGLFILPICTITNVLFWKKYSIGSYIFSFCSIWAAFIIGFNMYINIR